MVPPGCVPFSFVSVVASIFIFLNAALFPPLPVMPCVYGNRDITLSFINDVLQLIFPSHSRVPFSFFLQIFLPFCRRHENTALRSLLAPRPRRIGIPIFPLRPASSEFHLPHFSLARGSPPPCAFVGNALLKFPLPPFPIECSPPSLVLLFFPLPFLPTPIHPPLLFGPVAIEKR